VRDAESAFSFLQFFNEKRRPGERAKVLTFYFVVPMEGRGSIKRAGGRNVMVLRRK
jgi:hypothetical protein